MKIYRASWCHHVQPFEWGWVVYSWATAFRRPWCFVGVGWGMYSWVGGGVGLGTYLLTFMWTCTWKRCYAVAVGWGMYSWVGSGVGWGGVGHVLRFMWTCTWSRCYAVAVGCGCRFWNSKSVDIPICTPPWHNMCLCGAGDQVCRIQILKGSWKNLKRWCEQKTAKNCENELVGGFEENPKMEVLCRQNDCFRFSAWN